MYFSIIPDCTLTTCCFCVHNKNTHAFSIEDIIENIEELTRFGINVKFWQRTRLV